MHIGNFALSKEGGWIGFIHTLALNAKVRLVPNDDSTSDKSPAFRVLIGNARVGYAWEAQTPGNPPKSYLRLRIDDPILSEPLNAALFPSDSGHTGQLVWSRKSDWRTNGKTA